MFTLADIEFGDLACFPVNETYEAKTCKSFKNESTCVGQEGCEWDYAGSGLSYQVLAGTAFITGTQCGNLRNFLPLRFYAKPFLVRHFGYFGCFEY